ncbi:hypothetical protein GGX14DRAFT_389175 [Mycena pura]|uniref:Uncharacterized protein n=1 Tax=Mycena pura TaxID=153505 RepID=A0AAD6YHU4_9AGAR|nr:hypothetical protein GGX14DRAFT_389175 [Mycena pura]
MAIPAPNIAASVKQKMLPAPNLHVTKIWGSVMRDILVRQRVLARPKKLLCKMRTPETDNPPEEEEVEPSWSSKQHASGGGKMNMGSCMPVMPENDVMSETGFDIGVKVANKILARHRDADTHFSRTASHLSMGEEEERTKGGGRRGRLCKSVAMSISTARSIDGIYWKKVRFVSKPLPKGSGNLIAPLAAPLSAARAASAPPVPYYQHIFHLTCIYVVLLGPLSRELAKGQLFWGAHTQVLPPEKTDEGSLSWRGQFWRHGHDMFRQAPSAAVAIVLRAPVRYWLESMSSVKGISWYQKQTSTLSRLPVQRQHIGFQADTPSDEAGPITFGRISADRAHTWDYWGQWIPPEILPDAVGSKCPWPSDAQTSPATENDVELTFVEEPLGLRADQGYGYMQVDLGQRIGPSGQYEILRKLGWGMNSITQQRNKQ